jgi:peptidoglycan/LPS O-acetylase OafA/YrhL
MMKDIAWTIFFFATTIFAFRVVTDPTLTLDSNPIRTGFLIAFFAGGALGALWMVTDIRQQGRTRGGTLLLSIVPYGFLYYYFNHVRSRESASGAEKFNPYR